MAHPISPSQGRLERGGELRPSRDSKYQRAIKRLNHPEEGALEEGCILGLGECSKPSDMVNSPMLIWPGQQHYLIGRLRHRPGLARWLLHRSCSV
ncbi:unnamed protein product [Cuscuta campestris]|uniref:Uncharacterized protein n=1 Tax=Cuscuta campestris TaxID=132261 RepID=A0A484NFR7_9ASTE|nr:unnamed protein product [Cuscuta campestris]